MLRSRGEVWWVGCGPETYRVTAALPALMAGRTVRDNIMEAVLGRRISTNKGEVWRGEPQRFNWGGTTGRNLKLKRRG